MQIIVKISERSIDYFPCGLGSISSGIQWNKAFQNILTDLS